MTITDLKNESFLFYREPPEVIRAQRTLLGNRPDITDTLELMPIPVVILNRYRQVLFFNKKFLEYSRINGSNKTEGSRPGEALGCIHAFESEGGCGTSDFCRLCGAINSILASIDGTKSEQECRLTKQNGDALDLLVNASPLKIEQEDFVLFTIRDISSEKRRRALERIFFHDLLNMVGCLYTSSKMISGLEVKDVKSLSSLCNIITDISHVLIEEIEGQRALCAAENNEIDVTPVKMDSINLLEKMAELYKNHRCSKGKTIEITSDSRSITFVNDCSLVKRVVGNMIKNALEAVKPGEKVKLFSKRDGNKILIGVHNPGYIPYDVQLQIFHRSFSTKGKGRGLGTYSMKLLCERYLKGEVSFSSDKEDGTTFIASFSL